MNSVLLRAFVVCCIDCYIRIYSDGPH